MLYNTTGLAQHGALGAWSKSAHLEVDGLRPEGSGCATEQDAVEYALKRLPGLCGAEFHVLQAVLC